MKSTPPVPPKPPKLNQYEEALRAEIDLMRKQVESLHEIYIATQHMVHRLTNYVSTESLRLAEGLQKLDETVEKLDEHLADHIRHCKPGASTPPAPPTPDKEGK